MYAIWLQKILISTNLDGNTPLKGIDVEYPRYFWRVYFKPTALACFVIFLGFWARKVLTDYEPNYFTLIFGSFVVAFLYGILGWYFVLSAEIKNRVPYLNRAPCLVRKLLALKS